MDNQNTSIIGQSSKSHGSIKSMSILVVDDDTTCLSIVAAILKSWKHQVVTVKHPIEALNILKIRGSSFDLVITDVHMPNMSGFELQKKIDQEFELPVVFMSADDEYGVMVKGLRSGASFFIVKPVTPNDLKDLWQFAFANRKGKVTREKIESIQQTPNAKRPCNKNNPLTLVTPKVNSSLANDISNDVKECQPMAQIEEETMDSCASRKKSMFKWTSTRHNQFLEAINRIGIDKVVPKTILEAMNVPGLTREHVASHLQKYRLFLKRNSETSSSIHFDALQSAFAAELPSEFLLRKCNASRYFPLSISPKLGLSSSFNHMHSSGSNSILGSRNDKWGFLNNKSNLKHAMFGNSTSFNDANNFVYGNKPNFPFYENVSKGIIMDQEKSCMAGKGIDNGLNIDISGFERIGTSNPQNHKSHSIFKELTELRSYENKGLEDSTSFVFGNELKDEMGNESGSIIPVLGGTCDDTLPKLGVYSSRDDNQPIFEPTADQQKNNNNSRENVGIIGPLDYMLDTKNNCFPQEFSDHGNANCTSMNQININSQTQTGGEEIQQSGGEEVLPNFGNAGNLFSDQNFQSFEQNLNQFDEDEYFQSFFSQGKDGGDGHHETF